MLGPCPCAFRPPYAFFNLRLSLRTSYNKLAGAQIPRVTNMQGEGGWSAWQVWSRGLREATWRTLVLKRVEWLGTKKEYWDEVKGEAWMKSPSALAAHVE